MSIYESMRSSGHVIAAAVDRFFLISERGSTIQGEVRAGLTTFFTVSYVLVVCPQLQVDCGMDLMKTYAATALTSCVTSLVGGMATNMPYVFTPSVGLVTYFTYSLVLEQHATVPQALATSLVAAVVLALLALSRILHLITSIIPLGIKIGTVAGIGLILCFVGLQYADMVLANPSTTVELNPINQWWPAPVLTIIGLITMASLHHLKVPGAVLIGILVTALGAWAAYDDWPQSAVNVPQVVYWGLDFTPLLTGQPWSYLAVIGYTLVLVFDMGGIMIGFGKLTGLASEDNPTPKSTLFYLIAVMGTIIGSITGQPPLIIAAESAVGISGEGGRTGLTAVVSSLLFLFALFFGPLFSSLPTVVSAPPLILTGVFMFSLISNGIDWSNLVDALPAFLTIVVQPFTLSVSNGIYFGIFSSLLLHFFTGAWIPSVRDIASRVKAQIYDRQEPMEGPAPEGDEASTMPSFISGGVRNRASLVVASEAILTKLRDFSINAYEQAKYDHEMVPELILGEPISGPSMLRSATLRAATLRRRPASTTQARERPHDPESGPARITSEVGLELQ